MFRNNDLDDYATMLSDPEVMRYISDGQPATREDAWRHLAMLLGHWQLRGYGMWAVTERGQDRAIGRLGLHNPAGWPGLEVGWLLKRSAWGRGYATEGACAALVYAFETLKRDSVISLIRPDNHASIRVAERLGEHFEKNIQFKGSAASIYRLDADTWRASLAQT